MAYGWFEWLLVVVEGHELWLGLVLSMERLWDMGYECQCQALWMAHWAPSKLTKLPASRLVLGLRILVCMSYQRATLGPVSPFSWPEFIHR